MTRRAMMIYAIVKNMATTLYRAYRPQTFADVIGQDHVVAALTSALRKNTVAHAYLFTGARGTGKTTVGRLLAKAVNCEQASEQEPICNTCAACTSITSGSNLDVVEIDAASNRGIDDIRLLKEQVQFPPQSVRRKVYIIDEVHMLTMEAFNALLKTLEEPPEHVIFILATTELHKVPITIVSRCQRLDFHRGTREALITNLKRVADAEKIRIDDDAVALIAELAEGGFRDSLTLLERVTQLDGDVTADAVRAQLGLGEESLTRQLLQALIDGDRAAAFSLLDAAYSKGANPPSVAQLVVMTARRMLYISAGATSAADADETSLAARLSLTEWRVMLEDWTQAIIDSRHSPVPPLALEIAAAKWLERASDVVAPPATPPPAAPAAAPREVTVQEPPVAAAPPKPMQQAPVADDGRQITPDEWADVIAKLTSFNHSLSKLLQTAQCGPVKNGTVEIAVAYQFHVDTLRQKANTNAVAEALLAVCNATVSPQFVVAQTTGSAGANEAVIDTINEVFVEK